MRDRYGLVLIAVITALLITIALPTGEHTGTAIIALQGGLLLAVLAATPPATSGRLARIAAVVAVAAGLAAAFGGVPGWLVLASSAVFLTAAIATLGRGTYALLQSEGVTAQVVAAALAIYVLLGLLFATVIGAIAGATDAAYFAQGTDGSQGDRVYYSFAVLTTTGFGDFTPALAAGRALSVAEMLIGQIYLVTIVGLLVGNLRRPAEQRAARTAAKAASAEAARDQPGAAD